MSIKRNVKFIENYIFLECAIRDAFCAFEGVGDYIRALECEKSKPADAELLHFLKKCKDTRNALVHDLGAMAHLEAVTGGDVKRLFRIAKDVRRSRDALSLSRAKLKSKRRDFRRKVAFVAAATVLLLLLAVIYFR